MSTDKLHYPFAEILDCTMRDGGYYTDWHFSDEFVRDYLEVMKGSADIVELGYRSMTGGGRWKSCDEDMVRKVVEPVLGSDNPWFKLAFMIDTKEITKINEKGEEELDSDMLFTLVHTKCRDSVFDVIRFATAPTPSQALVANHAVATIRSCSDHQWECYINYMQAHKLVDDNELLRDLFMTALNSSARGCYIADSFGSLTPYQVRSMREAVATTILGRGSRHDLVFGLHMHDNLGLGLANTIAGLEASDNRATLVDCTVTGMGRGCGNAKFEQLVMCLKGEIADGFDAFVAKHMSDQKWGWNLAYQVSGQREVHPTYVQKIEEKGYTGPDLRHKLQDLPYGKSKFDYELLDDVDAKDASVAVVIPARYQSSRFPGKPLCDLNGKPMIVRVAHVCWDGVGQENVYVATDNAEIAKVCHAYNINVIMTPSDCLTGTDRVAVAAKQIDADIIVNVQGDEPLMNVDDLVSIIAEKKSNMGKVINCASPILADEDPYSTNMPKMAVADNGRLVYASRSVVPQNKAGEYSNVLKQVCLYAFTKQELDLYHSDVKSSLESVEDIEILRFLEKGIDVHVLEVEAGTLAVDTPEDAEKVRDVLRGLYS